MSNPGTTSVQLCTSDGTNTVCVDAGNSILMLGQSIDPEMVGASFAGIFLVYFIGYGFGALLKIITRSM